MKLTLVRFWFLFVVMAMMCSRTQAALMLTFNPDFVWDASYVVIVNPQGRVLESLKGDLKSDSFLSLSNLKVSNKIAVDLQPYAVPTQMVQISAEKLLLLLDRTGSSFKLHGIQFGSFVEGSETISVAWFANGKAYATRQINNPGPVRVVPVGGEKAFRQRLTNILNTQNALQKAVLQPVEKRAQALSSFMKTHAHWIEIHQARRETLEQLAKCRQSATPVYRALLKDNKLIELHGDIAGSYALSKNANAGADLTAMLKTELAFWRKLGPRLRIGWWNDFSGKPYTYQQIEGFRTRYSKMYGILLGLRKLPYRGSKTTVTQLRDLWRSLPQLEDKSGLSQISEACDDILLQFK